MIFSGIKTLQVLLTHRIKPQCHRLNSSLGLGNANSCGRDGFGIINLWRLLNPSQFGRWRPRRQLPLGMLGHALLELHKNFFKVNTQTFKVSNLFNKVGRKLHLGQVNSARLEHCNGALMLVSESLILPRAASARDFRKWASAMVLESAGNTAFLASRQEENSSKASLNLPASIKTSPNPEVASQRADNTSLFFSGTTSFAFLS